MKLITLLFTLIALSSFGQKDYSKMDKTKLKEELESRDNQIKTLNDSLKKATSRYEKLKDEKLSTAKKEKNEEINKLKKIISDINKTYFNEVLESKYINNNDYLEKTDLTDGDILAKINKSNILLTSVKVDADEETRKICEKALNFNQNYSELYNIKENVLNKKYDEMKVKAALEQIKKLPALNANYRLEESKKKIIILLTNYSEKACSLKKQLDTSKLADQSPIIKQRYSGFEKEYSDYPYLVKIIKEIKNNVKDYTDDDLQPCEKDANNDSKPANNNETDKSTKN